nr:helix-turn-helix domain-containing protein [Duganella rivi]
MTGGFEYTLRGAGRCRHGDCRQRHLAHRTARHGRSRNRLLDAADQLATGSEIDLAALAQQLGCYDQSHFTTDFEKLIGKPPADYRRSCAVS